MKLIKFIHNNNKVVIVLGLLLITVGSCKKDDFLTVPPKGQVTDEITFSSETNADLFVNDIYNQLTDEKNDYNHTDSYADNSWTKQTHTGANTVRNGSISPSNVPTGPNGGIWNWENTYGYIRKCNLFFQQTTKYKANFSATWLKARTAEVTFFRAYFYSVLFTAYGGVPLITTPLNNTDGTDIFKARATLDETLVFIEKDCDAAAADLPAAIDKTGRPTKGAALTLKGWVELFAASPLCNTANDPAKWAKAAATNKQVMDSKIYSLFSDYATQFLAANNFNSETIFAKMYAPPSKGSKAEGQEGPVVVKGTVQCWGNYQPTQSLVDDYLMANGLSITDPASGYNAQNPYVGREPRFYQSIIYDGAAWQGDIITTRVGGNNQRAGGGDITTSGYYGRKLLDENIIGQTSLATSPSSSNWVIFRYGEVLLSYAEAQNEAVGPDASVYGAMQLIRTRAGLPNVAAGLTQAQMRASIRRERRIELSFEEKRWYDIRRWLITTGPTGVLTNPEFGINIVYTAGVPKYTPVNIYTNIFKDYQNWMPIPQNTIAKNPKLVQNPGY
ncbi:RagB/SusD family nutrient uptake outer membrane protein [Mucilaginibacter sp. UYCu711]|uniref:RagB/SusD family nutrient uptake outer membrane protein n=1 Tax=Mucilaginibacter sp. UYCu711 TaxID=3156339 RepID=UPI003D1F982B